MKRIICFVTYLILFLCFSGCVNKTVNVDLKIDDFIMYRNLNIQKLDMDVRGKNNKVRIDSNLSFAKGDVRFAIDADVDADGHIWSTVAFLGQGISVGDILHEVRVDDFLSGLPVNVELFVQANGKNMSEIMSTISDDMKWNIAYDKGDMVIYPAGDDESWLYCTSGSNNNAVRIGNLYCSKSIERNLILGL